MRTAPYSQSRGGLRSVAAALAASTSPATICAAGVNRSSCTATTPVPQGAISFVSTLPPPPITIGPSRTQ